MTTRLFWLSQSLAIEVDSFSWPQLERSLKIWLGEADLLWHGLSMLLEVWKVQGLILVKWPAIFFRQLCYTKPVRPAVGRGGREGALPGKGSKDIASLPSAGTGAPLVQLEGTFGKSCGKCTADLRNCGWYHKENPEQLIYCSICLYVHLHILSGHTIMACGNW